jgi:hypothetical protein
MEQLLFFLTRIYKGEQYTTTVEVITEGATVCVRCNIVTENM